MPDSSIAPILLAAATSAASSASDTASRMIPWKPFLTPMPVWDYWFWTLLPLAACIALVYKTTKTTDIGRVPRESLALTAWIVLGLLGAAAAIAIVVRFA